MYSTLKTDYFIYVAEGDDLGVYQSQDGIKLDQSR